MLVPINTCPLTANLAVPKFVVGGEVLMDNTDGMEKYVQTKTVSFQVCEFKTSCRSVGQLCWLVLLWDIRNG